MKFFSNKSPFPKALFFNMVILFLITFFYGCIILPVPYLGDDPFPDKKKFFINPGTITKATVIEKLGAPNACRLGEKIYIYAGRQRDWAWLYAYGVSGGTAGAGVTFTYKTHLLILEFNKNDVITAAQEFFNDTGELESGLYVVKNGGYSKGILNRSWNFSDQELILRGTPIMDNQAKRIGVPPGKSVIYYYKNFSNFSEARLDGRFSVDSGSDGFLMWVVDVGDHTIHAFPHDPYLEPLTINCQAGEKYYVEHNKSNKKETIIYENKLVGEKEILKRKLVIDRLATFDFD